MPTYGTLKTDCSHNTNFKCCVNKQFIHYVCINCQGVYHKCCIPKFRSKITFIKGNKIDCCSDFINSRDEEIKDSLEKTICELSEDSELKDKYIKRIKIEHEAFVIEASKREEEFTELVKNQEKSIQELKDYITLIQKSTQQHQKIEEKTITGVQNKTMITKNTSTQHSVNCTENNTNKMPPKKNINVQRNKEESRIIKPVKSVEQVHKVKRRQILLLTDETCITWQMRSLIDQDIYKIMSIRKPGASLEQVMENIDALVESFSLEDYVVIIGGSNDLHSNKIPSFRVLCSKLKLCTHTNILFTSIPYINNATKQNNLIYKYNFKLYDFLSKFNIYTEGHIRYVEINSKRPSTLNSRLVASNLAKIIKSTYSCRKNLTFINTSNKNFTDTSPRNSIILLDNELCGNEDNTQNINNMDIPQRDVVNSDSGRKKTSIQVDIAAIPSFSTPSDGEVSKEPILTEIAASTSNFLYPRLSQTTFLI